jgi:hypothetical protein
MHEDNWREGFSGNSPPDFAGSVERQLICTDARGTPRTAPNNLSLRWNRRAGLPRKSARQQLGCEYQFCVESDT